MNFATPPFDSHDDDSLAVAFHLLGVTAHDALVSLERRLNADAMARQERRIVVILCEHSPCITVGQRGSRRHIRMDNQELGQKQLPVRWVNRGGGCVLHTPGQLVVHVIAPLLLLNWSLTDVKKRLCRALVETLTENNFRVVTRDNEFLEGQTGILATVGLGESHGVTNYGAVLNVSPDMALFSSIDVTDPSKLSPPQKSTMSCLFAEHRQPVKMTLIRAMLMQHLADAFGSQRYHLYTGHPWLARNAKPVAS